MTTQSRQISRLAQHMGVSRDEATNIVRNAPDGDLSDLLNDIIVRMDAVEAKQSRPSPIHLKSWEEIERFAEKAAKSGMVPKDYVGKPDAIVIAVMMGAELGLAPMQSLQNIAVVNGRPSIWGDAMPALCRASGLVRSIREWSEGEGDNLTFYCESIRKDDPNPIIGKFSVGDAKRANLWKDTPTVARKSRDGGTYQADSGPWYSYPRRMLQMRARGFSLRDAFPDVLKGLISAEEAQDIPFEATGLTPRLEPVVETPAPKSDAAPSIIDWLKKIDVEFANAETGEVVDELMARPDVQGVLDDHSRPKARDRLQHIIDTAIKRTTEAESSAPTDPDAGAAGGVG